VRFLPQGFSGKVQMALISHILNLSADLTASLLKKYVFPRPLNTSPCVAAIFCKEINKNYFSASGRCKNKKLEPNILKKLDKFYTLILLL
jgi:hypothetical protein